jgi:putative membrane protein
MENSTIETKYKKFVIALAIIIPLAVAALFAIKIEGYDFSFLPPIYSAINLTIAVLLILAVIAIKNGNKKRHRLLIRFAILGSILFLVGYILYHSTSGDTKYGDLNHNGEISDLERSQLGFDALVYYIILITHIILSIAVIPLVLLTYLKGWANNIESHKKLAKYTFPIWLYVSITGPIVYFMIKPFYG